MVHGLEVFKEYFKNFTNQYVLIGGTACDILLEETGTSFRSTNDLDIVLILEEMDASFGSALWEFIIAGGYEQKEKSTGGKQFFRFSIPQNSSYPKTIELFCRKPSYIDQQMDSKLTPIHIDNNIVSLSAILLNDAYYDVLRKQTRSIKGLSVLKIETLILFKIKAWLDLKQRKENGEQIDSNNVKKHRNDIFRLLANVNPTSRLEVTDEICNDIHQFLVKVRSDKPDLVHLGIREADFDELLKILEDIFLNIKI